MEQKIGNIFGFTGGNYAGNVYDKDHLSPTLNTMQGGYKQPMIIDDTYTNRQPRVYEDYSPALRSEREGLKTIEVKQLGFMDNGTGKHQSNTVYDENALCHNITTIQGGGTQQIKILSDNSTCMVRTEEGKALSTVQKDNYICVAMRGRNPTNPSDRTPGIELEQTLEVNQNGTTNCLTSVQKDNLVLEKPVLLGGVGEENEFGTQYRQGNRVYSSNAVAMCLNSQPIGNTGGNSYLYNVNYRIRKLTPKECWRLMDFSDEDFEKAAEVNSNTQLYKQAGNSIVVNVLVAILGQLLPGKENVYKELSE